MIRIVSIAALAVLSGYAAELRGNEIKLDPGAETLRTTTLDHPQAIEAVFPFASTDRKSFTASVKIEVGTWNHYGSIKAGFRNSQYSGKRFEARMTKGDDRLRSVAMDVEVAPGSRFEATLCDIPPEAKTFTVIFQHNAHLNRYKMIVTRDSHVLGESDWIKIHGYLSLDTFYVQAARGREGLAPGSSLSWEAERKALRAVSHAGNEGGYKYLMELLVKEVVVQTNQ